MIFLRVKQKQLKEGSQNCGKKTKNLKKFAKKFKQAMISLQRMAVERFIRDKYFFLSMAKSLKSFKGTLRG